MRFFLFIVSVCAALTPGKLPNGELRRYSANKQSPSSDLYAVQKNEACIVAQHWVNNIVAQPEVPHEDAHIVERIEKLRHFAEANTDERYIYLLWMPKGVLRDVLFIALVRVDDDVTVSLLVPSPYWDSTQIGSHKLKRALQDLAHKANQTLDLEALYRNDVRYKLSWKCIP